MRKYTALIIGLVIAVSIFVFVPHVFAENFGLEETAKAADLTKYGSSVPTIAGNIIGTLLSMISVLFFVLVLYGGILWMTARGNAETTGKALNTIIAATIGIIIVMGAYALTNFVFKLGQNTGGSGTDITATTPGLSCIADAGYCAGFSGESACDTNYCVYLDVDADNDGSIEGCVPLVQTACTNLPQQQCSSQAHCIWGRGDNGP